MSARYFSADCCGEIHNDYDGEIEYCECCESAICYDCLPEEVNEDTRLDNNSGDLKAEYCPVCKKEKENEKDPEYAEYLRLKMKFE